MERDNPIWADDHMHCRYVRGQLIADCYCYAIVGLIDAEPKRRTPCDLIDGPFVDTRVPEDLARPIGQGTRGIAEVVRKFDCAVLTRTKVATP